MSIKLQLAPYCGNCGRFEAYTEKSVGEPRKCFSVEYNEEQMVSPVDFVIKCSHRAECEQIMEYLRKNVE